MLTAYCPAEPLTFSKRSTSVFGAAVFWRWNTVCSSMNRPPRDDENGPFEEMFRMVERMVEKTAENMDRAMGPYGNVDFWMDHRIAVPGRERLQNRTATHVDVQEEDDAIRVVADLPGVSNDDIAIRCTGRTLSITAAGDRRDYNEQIQLPARVDKHAATATYNNGILDITLPRHDAGSDDTTITVE